VNDRFDYETRDAAHTVFVPSELTVSDCEQQASRLRSWALIRDEAITGNPYLRLCGALRGEVHLPTAGEKAPHPEVGVNAADSLAGPVARVDDVPFKHLLDTVRDLEGELGTGPGIAGPAEFHPATRDSWTTGTVLWPVHAIPATREKEPVSHSAS